MKPLSGIYQGKGDLLKETLVGRPSVLHGITTFNKVFGAPPDSRRLVNAMWDTREGSITTFHGVYSINDNDQRRTG
jgi:hypothetical protein